MGQRIAKVSGTPGKTRALNVYVVGGWWPVAREHPPSITDHRPPTTDYAFYLLDLPGYGYARASKSDRVAFSRIVRHVLHRPRLSGVVWLLDIRHEPSEGDRAMQDLLAGAESRVLVAATKADKLSHAQQRQRERTLRQALALDEDQIVVTSARTGHGMPELREAIAALARAA